MVGYPACAGGLRQLPVAEAAAVRMEDFALPGDTVVHRDRPLVRGRGHQHLPGGRADRAQQVPAMAETAAAAGQLGVPLRVLEGLRGQRHFDLHPFPGTVQFVGNDHGNAGVGALAEVGLPDPDRHRLVGADLQEGVRLERHRRRAASRGRVEQGRRHGHCAGGEHQAAGLQEKTSRHFAGHGVNLPVCGSFRQPVRWPA